MAVQLEELRICITEFNFKLIGLFGLSMAIRFELTQHFKLSRAEFSCEVLTWQYKFLLWPTLKALYQSQQIRNFTDIFLHLLSFLKNGHMDKGCKVLVLFTKNNNKHLWPIGIRHVLFVSIQRNSTKSYLLAANQIRFIWCKDVKETTSNKP